MGAPGCGSRLDAAQFEASKLAVDRQYHIADMSGRVNPAEIVENAPVHMIEIGKAQVAPSGGGENRLYLLFV